MSDFDAMMEDANDALLDFFGDAATYTDKAGNAISIDNAIWVDDPVEHQMQNYGTDEVAHANCHISEDDVADPDINGTITYEAVVWHIETKHQLPGGLWELELIDRDAVSRHRSGYRTHNE